MSTDGIDDWVRLKDMTDISCIAIPEECDFSVISGVTVLLWVKFDNCGNDNGIVSTHKGMTDSSTPNSQGMKAFSLCMFCFAPSIKLSRVVPLALNNRGTGSKLVTRSGVFEIPVVE